MRHPSRSVVKDLLSIGGSKLEPYSPRARLIAFLVLCRQQERNVGAQPEDRDGHELFWSARSGIARSETCKRNAGAHGCVLSGYLPRLLMAAGAFSSEMADDACRTAKYDPDREFIIPKLQLRSALLCSSFQSKKEAQAVLRTRS